MGGDGASIKLYDFLRVHVFGKTNKFSNSRYEEFDDDLLMLEITKIRTYVTHNVVPKRFKVEDGLLKPQNPALRPELLRRCGFWKARILLKKRQRMTKLEAKK